MIEALLLAFGLAMDAFAVSIGLGIKSKQFNISLAFRIAFLFGFFQALMPLFGYLVGTAIGEMIAWIDHWIAFALLSAIGIKMIYEGTRDKDEEIETITNKVLLLLAIATSIDALVAGFTLNLLSINPYISMLIIGIVTFAFSFLGVYLGVKGEGFLKSRAEKTGGVILIGIGVKILIEHLFFI
ncbi:MAG: manganese efflux pump MntP family protein [Campylobacterales bacterium]